MTQGMARDRTAKVDASDYMRPDDWIDLPEPVDGVNLIAAVPEGGSSVALLCRGAYTVNWGDGSAPENVADNVKATHQYSYADPDLDGTECSRGYKQALVQVYSQSPGGLSTFSLQQSITGYPGGYASVWLEASVKCVTLGTINFGGSSGEAIVRHGLIEQVTFSGATSVTNGSYLFRHLRALQSVVGTEWSSNVTVMSYMFDNCNALKTLPPLDTSNVTAFVYAFASTQLIDFTQFDYSSAIDMTGAFSVTPATHDSFIGCDFSSPTVWSASFLACYCLDSLPSGLGMVLGASGGQMFQNCFNLVSLPNDIDFSGVTNTATMFSSCYRLKELPAADFSSVTSAFQMFINCISLREIPDGMFSSALTSLQQTFQGCAGLRRIGVNDFSNVSVVTNFLQSCPALQQFRASPLPAVSFSIASCVLTASELDLVYTALPVAVATITVTGNPGVSGDDPSIATGKGWTVTGS